MPKTHNLVVGSLLWLFGFMGSHRFYCGRPITGTIWFFTLELLLIGRILDLLLMPAMVRAADRHYALGTKNYTAAWVLLTFLGILGLHRMYLAKLGHQRHLSAHRRPIPSGRALRLLDPQPTG